MSNNSTKNQPPHTHKKKNGAQSTAKSSAFPQYEGLGQDFVFHIKIIFILGTD